MARKNRLPKRFYKYRDFTARTLDMVVGDKLHFADPSTFNDPLDTRPSLKNDVDDGELKKVLSILTAQRAAAEMHAAAHAMRLKGPKTTDLIEKRSRGQADQLIAEIECGAADSEYNTESALRSQLRYRIELELLRRYDRGIVSFAEQDDSLLMWSHYGDQHRGICMGYSVPDGYAGDIHKVEYGGGRLVRASDVAAMLDGDGKARAKVDKSVLLRKAESWSYEREWRLLGPRGTRHSPLELEEIIFGMKCKESAIYAVMTALKGRRRAVEFYAIREERGTFNLKKCPLSYDDELFVHFPYRSLSLLEMFKPIE